jgi:cell division protein FtsB
MKNIILVFLLFFLFGCNDAELKQLEINSAKLETENSLLKSTIKTMELDTEKLEKDLFILRDNNKDLNVSLAKSELLFSKKHKEELEIERNKLDEEKTAFKSKKEMIEEKAYVDVEKELEDKYLIVISVLSLIVILLCILLYYSWTTNKKNKEDEIKKLKTEKEDLENENTELNKNINKLANDIEDLNRKQKSGIKNQVLTKIEEHTAKRELRLNHIGGI